MDQRPSGGKCVRTCDDPRRGGERGSSPRPTRGGRSRTGLARSRTIRDFHGVPESLLRQTHAPHLTPNGGRLCSASWKTTRLPRTAAFFDLDKTVIAKSSTLTFSKSFYQGGLINRRAVLRTAYAQFVFLAGGADHDQMERMREYLSALCRGWNVAAGQGDRRRDAARPDRPDHLRRGRLPHRGAPHRRPGRGDRLHLGRRGRRADRRAARRGPGGGHPHGRRRGRLLHRRGGVLRLRPDQGGGDPGARRVRGVRPRRAATPTAIRRPTCRCWRRSATRTRSTRTGRCAARRSRAGGRFSPSTARSGSSSGSPRCPMPPRPALAAAAAVGAAAATAGLVWYASRRRAAAHVRPYRPEPDARNARFEVKSKDLRPGVPLAPRPEYKGINGPRDQGHPRGSPLTHEGPTDRA